MGFFFSKDSVIISSLKIGRDTRHFASQFEIKTCRCMAFPFIIMCVTEERKWKSRLAKMLLIEVSTITISFRKVKFNRCQTRQSMPAVNIMRRPMQELLLDELIVVQYLKIS